MGLSARRRYQETWVKALVAYAWRKAPGVRRRMTAAGLRPVVYKGILRVPLPGYFVHAMSPLFRWFSSAIFVISARDDSP